MKRIAIPIALAILLFSLTFRLDETPPAWFDEGWVMSVARNWVELGHYGQLLDGKPIPPSMLNVGIPVIAPIALSFRLFGVGIWQGRLPGVLFTVGALFLLYYLTLNLYDRKVAVGTLFVALFMSGNLHLHPLFIGRQALGEIPAVFFLLAGYISFLSWRRLPLLLLPLSAFFWGLAAAAKMQALPFLVAGLAAPIAVALPRKRWKTVVPMLAGLCGFLAWFWLFRQAQEGLMRSPMFPKKMSLYATTAIVPILPVRLTAAAVLLFFGLPALLGICYGGWQYGTGRAKLSLDNDADAVRQSLLFLVAGWMAWYLLLSIGWERYLFIPVLLGSMFAAVMLRDFTSGFSIPLTVKSAADTILRLRFGRRNVCAIAAVLLQVSVVSITIASLYFDYPRPDRSHEEVAKFINTTTPTDALIETFDMELFVLLNRRYHYPSDEIQLQLNRRTSMGQNVPVDYDPMSTDPDYLVVGPHSGRWRLYDPTLQTDAFRLVLDKGRYQVYERVRTNP
jgi:4-amino-4-deoxy-L-arabinose transferase-like glycosyltransferase